MSRARERHAQHYLKFLTAHQQDWEAIDREFRQILRTWEWVSRGDQKDSMLAVVWGCEKYLERRGLFELWISWAAATRDLCRKQADSEGLSSMLIHLGYCLRARGDLVGATQAYQEALDFCQVIRDAKCQGRALNSLAALHHETGRSTEGLALLREALQLYSEAGDEEGNAPRVVQGIS